LEMLRAAEVTIPGSTANVGAGFDHVAVAIDRWLLARAHLGRTVGGGAVVRRRGTLRELSRGASVSSDHDLLVRGFRAACSAANRLPPDGLTIHAESSIPVARGLGSSAAGTVAGVLLANALLGLEFDVDRAIGVAAGLEGHADNVAASVLGGATLVVGDDGGRYHAFPIALEPQLRFVIAVPAFQLETATARAVLPERISHATGVAAACRASALVEGLRTGSPVLLGMALDDVLHVPHRRSLIAGYDAVVAGALRAGAIGATISGAGPSILAITTVGCESRVGRAMVRMWKDAGVGASWFGSPAVDGATACAL
jgi:homoserine kinase